MNQFFPDIREMNMSLYLDTGYSSVSPKCRADHLLRALRRKLLEKQIRCRLKKVGSRPSISKIRAALVVAETPNFSSIQVRIMQ